MRFLTTPRGDLINSRHIVKLESGDIGARATLVDGERVIILDSLAVLKEGLRHDVVPAAPGFLLAVCFPEDPDEPGVIRTSDIVAWRMNDYGGPTPITYDGHGSAHDAVADSGASPKAIITPSGGVYEWQNERWADSVDEFKQRAIEEAKAKKGAAA